MIRIRTYRSTMSRLAAGQCTVGVALATLANQALLAETPKDYRCAKDGDVRRIEIRFEDEQGRLPCRVIYRPEAESDTMGTVSWRGIGSLQVCQAQAQEVIGRLSAEGWSCAVEIRAAIAAEPARSDPPRGSLTDATPEAVAAVDSRIATLAEPIEDLDEPARLVGNPGLAPPTSNLTALIKDGLQQLDAALDGRLEAQIADYGDLNADDIADALVVFTYMSPQPAYRQFLAAYLFDGENYQLTATRPIGGSASATMGAKVDEIDQGIVHLSMRAFEPGDAACCPSGLRRMTLALRDLDLVEISETTPTR